MRRHPGGSPPPLTHDDGGRPGKGTTAVVAEGRSGRLGQDLTQSALGVLGGAAGLVQTGLLALHDARVASEETGLLQGGAVGLTVDLVERAGDAQAQGAGLAGDATAVDTGDDVEAASRSRMVKGARTSCWCSLLGK